MNGHDSRERPVVFPYEGEVVRCPVRRAVEAVAILAVHKQPEVRAAIEAAGARIRFSAALQPDFNPIEQAFAKLKAFLRAARPRNFDHVTALVAAALATKHLTSSPREDDPNVIGETGVGLHRGEPFRSRYRPLVSAAVVFGGDVIRSAISGSP